MMKLCSCNGCHTHKVTAAKIATGVGCLCLHLLRCWWHVLSVIANANYAGAPVKEHAMPFQ